MFLTAFVFSLINSASISWTIIEIIFYYILYTYLLQPLKEKMNYSEICLFVVLPIQFITFIFGYNYFFINDPLYETTWHTPSNPMTRSIGIRNLAFEFTLKNISLLIVSIFNLFLIIIYSYLFE
jgi:hypothetical protein